MRLQGDEGYYADEITIEDVSFCFRELTDEEQEQARGIGEQVVAKRRAQTALARRVDTENDLSDDEFSQMNALGQAALKSEREMYDMVVSAGLVAWDGFGDTECTPENAVRLPNHVKAQLTRAIGKETSLSFDEADFSAGQPTA